MEPFYALKFSQHLTDPTSTPIWPGCGSNAPSSSYRHRP